MSYGDPNTPALPPPGWYADPSNPAQERWWAGPSWTDHVRIREVEIETYQPMAGYTAAPRQFGTGHGFTVQSASANTVPIWLLAFSPVLSGVISVIGQFLLPLSQRDVSTGLTFAWWGVVLGLVIWDHMELKRRDLPAPSWAWFLLTVVAYFIARRIALKRGGVKNDAPGNVFAGIILLSLVVVVGATLALLSSR